MTALSQRSGVTQLEFHQAMNDFKTMFPEMDEDVIEAVLRANNGAVDATIDQLLQMNMDSENERLRQELDASDNNNEVPPRYSPATPPPSYNSLQSQPIPLNTSPNRRSQQKESNNKSNNLLPQMSTKSMTAMNAGANLSNPSTDSMRYKRQWNPPILGLLPHNFLRIEPDENQRKLSGLTRPAREVTVINSALLQQKMEENQRQRQMSVSADDPELAQFLEDERVAIFLQNEEFVRELRRNKDFMSTLELDSSGDLSGSNSTGLGTASNASTHTDSDAAFKETVRHMGKVSRRKFAQLARLFSRRRRRSFQQLLSESSNPSQQNLLLREDEYIQFQNEGSDNEESVRENPLVLAISDTEEHSNQNIANNTNSSLNNNTFRSNQKI